MPTAAALLDRIGRPGDLSLGTARPEPLGRLPTGLAVLDEALGGGLPRGRIAELAFAGSIQSKRASDWFVASQLPIL